MEISAYIIPGLSLKGKIDSKLKCLLSTEEITQIICEVMGVTREQIDTKSRVTNIKLARQFSHAMIRKYLPRTSFADIGKMVGNKDHSTVIYSCRIVDETYRPDRELGPIVREIEQKIRMANMVKEIKQL